MLISTILTGCSFGSHASGAPRGHGSLTQAPAVFYSGVAVVLASHFNFAFMLRQMRPANRQCLAVYVGDVPPLHRGRSLQETCRQQRNELSRSGHCYIWFLAPVPQTVCVRTLRQDKRTVCCTQHTNGHEKTRTCSGKGKNIIQRHNVNRECSEHSRYRRILVKYFFKGPAAPNSSGIMKRNCSVRRACASNPRTITRKTNTYLEDHTPVRRQSAQCPGRARTRTIQECS